MGVVATYGNCAAGAVVTTNCVYMMDSPEDLAGERPGELDDKHETSFEPYLPLLDCEINLKKGVCEIKIGKRAEGRPKVMFENGLPLKASFEVTGLTYVGRLGCPVTDEGVHTNGKYKGKLNIETRNGGEVKIN
jgi:hypothetical protein